jgi:hypothetical protein
MPLLKAEAEKLSNNDLVAGIVEEIIDHDDLFELMPFSQTSGKAYIYNRENTLSEATFIDPNEVVTEGAATFTEVTTKLRILIGDVDVDKFLDEVNSDTSSQKATQIALKAKGLGRAFRRALINGDNGVDAKSFDGVQALVSENAGQIIAAGANGAAVTLSMLDDLIDKVDNGADALMMRRATWRAIKALHRAAGGNTGAMLQVENYGVMPAHDGIPVIINDFIPVDLVQGTNSASTAIYAMRLNEIDGLHGLWGGRDAGIRFEDIGTVQNKDATRSRLKWYCGVALKSTKSLASLNGVTNV